MGINDNTNQPGEPPPAAISPIDPGNSNGLAKPHAWILKAAIFATGLAGIVAEYVMSTLASYLIGNAVLQWALTLSLMLFAMGIGSRASKSFKINLLETFIVVEILLSVVTASSATVTYFLFAYIEPISVVIYPTAFVIGFLIGLEIPLVTRLNQKFEELRINISSVMELDYYGALLGGLVFAFVALPHLGMTYTPIFLGCVNFLVAVTLYWTCSRRMKVKRYIHVLFILTVIYFIGLFIYAKPLVLFGEQKKYQDKVIYQEQSPYQRIVITQWKDHYWLYLNGSQQFSSYDEERYHEPLVHPAMHMAASNREILILGGGDGMAARNVLEYPGVNRITLVDLDPAMTNLGKDHPILQELNKYSLWHKKVKVLNNDAYRFLMENRDLYDVIIVDLPDPKSSDLARLYSKEFYMMARNSLTRGGVMVTQATSPMFARKTFLCIYKTMKSTGLPTAAYHTHIPTMGEWGWIIALNIDNKDLDLKNHMRTLRMDKVKTIFLDRDAMTGLTSFGKDMFTGLEDIPVNSEHNIVLPRLYHSGRWDMY